MQTKSTNCPSKRPFTKISFSRKIQLHSLVLIAVTSINLLWFHYQSLLYCNTIEYWDTYWNIVITVFLLSFLLIQYHKNVRHAHCSCEHTIYIHLYVHLIPTSQCLGSTTVTSCNFPHKSTVCNTATGLIPCTVTFLKHFKFGRAAATTSPAPIKLKKSII